MRRSLLLSLILAAALPGVAPAAQTAELDVAAELLSQPVGRPWAINLETEVAVTTPDGGPPSPLRRIDIRFPHATLNDGRFPACDVEELRKRGPRGCPRASRVGRGTAIVDVRPLLDFPIHADIAVYNGPRRRGGRILLFDAIGREVRVQVLLQALLKRASGRYGYRLTVDIPPIRTIPGANEAAISTFGVKVGGRRGRHSFLEAPRRCPRGGLPFAGTFGYADGTRSRTTATISCTLRSSRGG